MRTAGIALQSLTCVDSTTKIPDARADQAGATSRNPRGYVNEVVRVRNARKRFGRTPALEDLSLTLFEGECLGLVGPNGAGKTTTVRAICGTVALDSGSITWPNTAGAERSSLLGLVPQEIALYPLLTGRENLEVFGGLLGLRAAALRGRVAHALEWSGLASRADEPVGRWSVGMKRRLNIACGVLHEPRVILLDEPTAGVDPESRRRIWDLLLGLRATGVSLLVTTHQLSEAQSVSDRIAVVRAGTVIATGSADQIVREVLGAEHRVVIHLENGARLAARMANVTRELPALLRQIEERGDAVRQLDVRAPDLEEAFLQLLHPQEGPHG